MKAFHKQREFNSFLSPQMLPPINNEPNAFPKQIVGTEKQRTHKVHSEHLDSMNKSVDQNQSLLMALNNSNTSGETHTKGAHSFSTRLNNISQSSSTNNMNIQYKSQYQQSQNLSYSLSTAELSNYRSKHYKQKSINEQPQNLIQLNNSGRSISFASKRANNSYSLVSNASQVVVGGAPINQKKTFYHHSNIFNLKQYQSLANYSKTAATDEDDMSPDEDLEEVKNQRKRLLIREFRQKVDQYLLFSKYRKEQATKEFNTYYSQVQDTLFNNNNNSKGNSIHHKENLNKSKITQGQSGLGGLSFLSQYNNSVSSNAINKDILVQDNSMDTNISNILQQNQLNELNKSAINIDANRFNYTRLSKEQASKMNSISLDIFIEDDQGKSSQKTIRKIDNNRLSNMILAKFNHVISDDDQHYDQKMEQLTKEYERILQKIETKSFRLKVPYYYEPQMQPYNEFYHIDYSKKNNLQWNEIENELLDQVIMQDQISKEDEDDHEEEQDDEMEKDDEDQEEEEKQEDSHSGEEEEVEEQKKATQINEKITVPEIKLPEKTETIAQEEKKKNKKPKQKKQKVEIELQQESQQEIYIDPQTNSPQPSSDRNQLSQEREVAPAPKKPVERKTKRTKERSAIDEYVVYRPSSPPKQKKKQEKANPPQQQQQPKSIPKKIIKPAETEIPQPAQPVIEQPHPSTPKVNQKERKERSVKEENINQNKVIVPASQQQIIVPKQETLPQATPRKLPVSPRPEVVVPIVKQQEAKALPEIQKEKSSVAVDLPQQKKLEQVIGEKIKQIKEEKVQPTVSNIKQKEQNLPIQKIEQPLIKQEKPQQKQQQVDEDDDDDDEDEEEEEEEEKEEIVTENKGDQNLQVKKNNDKINTPKNKEGSPKGNPKFENENRQEQDILLFKNDTKAKRRIGTGLIDELVKINYLLEFNVTSYKKERKRPEIPNNLEFKGEEEKLLFDSIFQWQYQVDLEIEEIEQQLNQQKEQEKLRKGDSDDDEDEEESNGRRRGDKNGNDDNSVHSSEITDFGPAAPFRTSLNDVASDDLSDFEQ